MHAAPGQGATSDRTSLWSRCVVVAGWSHRLSTCPARPLGGTVFSVGGGWLDADRLGHGEGSAARFASAIAGSTAQRQALQERAQSPARTQSARTCLCSRARSTAVETKVGNPGTKLNSGGG